uniref:Uncharacterized protein n=1 Tax=Romanomermis culicivorax TaxID=13658 RepID=A0A915L525_ROMCU
MHLSIKSSLEEAANVSKNYFSKKAHKCHINVNDLALLTNTGKANKIQPNFIGPFIVTDTTHLDENVATIEALDAPSRPQTVSTLQAQKSRIQKITVIYCGRSTTTIHPLHKKALRQCNFVKIVGKVLPKKYFFCRFNHLQSQVSGVPSNGGLLYINENCCFDSAAAEDDR